MTEITAEMITRVLWPKPVARHASRASCDLALTVCHETNGTCDMPSTMGKKLNDFKHLQ
jgi:hypothetical protein